jgi:hypothetical protein
MQSLAGVSKMRSVPKKQVIRDIRSGMRDRDLMSKYGLTLSLLRRLLQRLVAEEAIDHEILYVSSETYREATDILSLRRNARTRIPMSIRVYTEEDCQRGYLRDVSETGLRLAGIEVEVGDWRTLTVPLKEIPTIQPIEFEGVCRWAKHEGKFRRYAVIGVEIAAISDDSQWNLSRLIDLFQATEAEETTECLCAVRVSEATPSNTSHNFSGAIDEVDILDVIQFMLLNRKKVLLDIRSPEEDHCKVYIMNGNIIHAVRDNLTGPEAFMDGMMFEGGNFLSLPWEDPEEPTIFEPGELLLLEAARKRDESFA